jgi:hypothetical protein
MVRLCREGEGWERTQDREGQTEGSVGAHIGSFNCDKMKA